jgi:hypothetical protein
MSAFKLKPFLYRPLDMCRQPHRDLWVKVELCRLIFQKMLGKIEAFAIEGFKHHRTPIQ